MCIRDRKVWATASALLVTTVVFLTMPGVLGTITNLFTGISSDSSVASRTGSYDVASMFISRSPLLGRGFGTFLPKYWILDNGYLGLLIEGGALGLLGLLIVIATAVGCAFRSARIHVHTAERGQLDREIAADVPVQADILGVYVPDDGRTRLTVVRKANSGKTDAVNTGINASTQQLVAIVDANGSSADGPTSDVMNIEPVAGRFEAFGWRAIEMDGHDVSRIVEVLDELPDARTAVPTVIVARTLKGKGVSFMEESPREWHLGFLGPDDRQRAENEIRSRMK